MFVKMNKTKKSNRNESCMSSPFLVYLFFPVMTNLAAGSGAGESASLTLEQRDSLESKLLTTSLKKFLVCRRLSILNQCIGEENQGQNDKKLKILGKDFKKLTEEKKLLL